MPLWTMNFFLVIIEHWDAYMENNQLDLEHSKWIIVTINFQYNLSELIIRKTTMELDNIEIELLFVVPDPVQGFWTDSDAIQEKSKCPEGPH